MDENNGGPVSPTPEEAGPTPDSDDGPSTKKRSRRAVEKKVVSVPIGPRNKAGGETAPPTDSWAWRKYGQKPIKGSPYPRGYYRCSSSKGCPARKQVERSRVDPTLMVVTYSSEHNHPVPIPRNHSGGGGGGAAATRKKKAKKAAAKDEEEEVDRGGRIEADTEEGFEDIIAGETGIVIGGEEFRWFSDVGSPSTSASPTEGSDDTLLYGSIAGCSAAEVAMLLAEEKLGVGEGEGEEEEEDSLFAGLGELPECSVVFRRGSAATASIR